MRAVCRFIRVGFEGDAVGHIRQISLGVFERLRVGDDDFGVFGDQLACNQIGRAFAGVASVGFEREAEQGNAFAGNGVEHLFEHAGDKAAFLILIHFHDLVPVFGHFS